MKMNILGKFTKQATAALLAFIMTSSGTVLFANENVDSIDLKYEFKNSGILNNDFLENKDYHLIEAHGFWTTAKIRLAIRGIIASKNLVLSAVRQFGSSAAVKAVENNFNTIINELNRLLSWTTLDTQMVYDAIRRALIAVGVSTANATSAAHAIRTALDWFL